MAASLHPPSLPPSPSAPANSQNPTSILRRASVAVSDTESERSLTFAIAAPRAEHSGPPLRLEVFEDSETPWEDSAAISTSEFPFARPTHYRGRQPGLTDEERLPRDQGCSRHRSPPPRARANSERPRRFIWQDKDQSSGGRRGSVPSILPTDHREPGQLQGRSTSLRLSPSQRALGKALQNYACPPTVDDTPVTARSMSPQVDDLCTRLGTLARGSPLELPRTVKRPSGE
ncbi:hypothetical protein BD324DRAFT_241798 [Kockovaella imperatae]|uniref:Uncharacterized protein n=1 Tax=Kockovaella imperatae TaxID=4999 RepID=A0A1Y1UQQ2_9TREE|nr:hypothetical protein BD324DRAFT_241798 [Kockovaella imperatae]ORX39897.1 hypothetical protein BD324DRAFT_241798 [Kockovaella imperatae]